MEHVQVLTMLLAALKAGEAKGVEAAQVLGVKAFDKKGALKKGALWNQAVKHMEALDSDVLAQAEGILKGTSFTPEAGCESQLSCRETGECLGLCQGPKDEAIHTEADALAVAADAGAQTIGEVLPEAAIEGHNPETPIVVQRETTTAPLPVIEVVTVRYEDRDYEVHTRDNGNVDFISPQGSKTVHAGFIVDWQRGLRQPTIGAKAIIEGGKVVALRLLQAYTWSLNKGKGRKNPTPVIETTPAPESANTQAAEPAKTEETIVTETQQQTEAAVEMYAFDVKAFHTICVDFVKAGQDVTRLAWKLHDRGVVAAREALIDAFVLPPKEEWKLDAEDVMDWRICAKVARELPTMAIQASNDEKPVARPLVLVTGDSRYNEGQPWLAPYYAGGLAFDAERIIEGRNGLTTTNGLTIYRADHLPLLRGEKVERAWTDKDGNKRPYYVQLLFVFPFANEEEMMQQFPECFSIQACNEVLERVDQRLEDVEVLSPTAMEALNQRRVQWTKRLEAAKTRRDLVRAAEDARLDAHTNAVVKARAYLAEMWKRYDWAAESINFTNLKLAERLLSLFDITIEEALALAAESRKNLNPAPTEAPITEETIVSQPTAPVSQSAESNPAPESAKPEEKPVSQPTAPQSAPEAPKPATKEEVEEKLAELNARYAAHPASDKKIKNTRNEGLTSINARIKKGEWSRAMEKINEALKTVPAVPVTEPVAPKAPAVETPKPTTVAGVTVIQGVFASQPIIPPTVEPAPKPVIDVKPVVETPKAPNATTQAAPKPAEQKKEATVPQQPVIETPKADESATTPAAPEAVISEEKSVKNDKKGPGMWAKLTAAVARFDRKVEFRCGPSKAPEGMDKVIGIVQAATVGVQPGEFVSSTGTGVGIKIVRKAAEIVEEAINIAHMNMKLGYEIEAGGQTMTFAQWRLAAEKQPELQAIVDQGSAGFEAEWSNKLPLFMPGIVESALAEFYKGKEEGVSRALIMSALIEAFHVRNPAKRSKDWKLDRTLVKGLIVGENITDAQVESLAKAGEKILNGGGAAEAKAMLRGLEAASIHGEDNTALIGSIPDVAMVGALITGAKMFVCCGNASIVSSEQVEALADSNMIVEFDNLLTALANQKFAFPKDPSRLDCLAGFGSANLGEVGQNARLYCIVQGAESLVGSEGGPEFVRLMIQIRSAKKVESLEKVKGGRGVVRKTTWAIYVAGKWLVLAVVAVAAWAFLPAKVVYYAGKAAAYKVASLFAGKDEAKKADRNAAAGEAWACCKTAAVDIVMRPVRFVKRVAVSGYSKIKGWFTKSGEQSNNGTEQSANEKKEGTMGLFTGVLSQKFGENKGTEFSKQTWYMKAASIAMSPFVASWRVAKAYTTEVVVAAASAGIAVILGASALVVGGAAVVGAAVGMAARWIGKKFFGKKDAATTTAPAAQQAAA